VRRRRRFAYQFQAGVRPRRGDCQLQGQSSPAPKLSEDPDLPPPRAAAEPAPSPAARSHKGTYRTYPHPSILSMILGQNSRRNPVRRLPEEDLTQGRPRIRPTRKFSRNNRCSRSRKDSGARSKWRIRRLRLRKTAPRSEDPSDFRCGQLLFERSYSASVIMPTNRVGVEGAVGGGRGLYYSRLPSDPRKAGELHQAGTGKDSGDVDPWPCTPPPSSACRPSFDRESGRPRGRSASSSLWLRVGNRRSLALGSQLRGEVVDLEHRSPVRRAVRNQGRRVLTPLLVTPAHFDRPLPTGSTSPSSTGDVAQPVDLP